MKKRLTALLLTSALTASALAGSGAISSFAASLKISGDQEQNQKDNADLPESDVFSGDRVELAVINKNSSDDENPEFSYGSVAAVAQACLPSIVAITNTSVQQTRDFFSRQAYEYEAVSAGTGIIVGENDDELLICTNNHVVDNANEITVTFADDECIAGQVKGTDPANDLAVVAVKLEDISEDTLDAIKIAPIGDSDEMVIGEQVVAIGNALGYGQSVTTGIISAFDRSIDIYDQSTGSASTYENLIQTDAAINAGNSGGALLNMDGEVIGINSAKASASGVEGMGYAIPVSKAKPILEKLMTRVTRDKVEDEDMGYIGINGQDVSSEATQLYDIPSGVYITLVSEDSPAEKAGLEEGDIIAQFDGEDITSMKDLQKLLHYYPAGEEVTITIYSKNDGAYAEKEITITLGNRSEMQ